MDIHNLISLPVAITLFVIFSAKYQQINSAFDAGRITIRSDNLFKYIYRYLQVSTLILVALSYTVKPAWILLIHQNPVIMYSGLIVAVISLIIFQSSIDALGKEYSPCFDLRQPVSFIRTGIYRYIRHPVYSSNLALLFGAFMATGSLLVLGNFIILFIFYYRSAKKEEADLLNRFTDYEEYKRNTGMFIITLSRG